MKIIQKNVVVVMISVISLINLSSSCVHASDVTPKPGDPGYNLNAASNSETGAKKSTKTIPVKAKDPKKIPTDKEE